MLTVVLVHGTGVRNPRYTAEFGRFRDRLLRMRADVAAVPCYWGGEHGSALRANGVTIPDRESTRWLGASGVLDEDEDIALWAILEADPLFELGLLAEAGEEDDSPKLATNQESPGVALAARASTVPAALKGAGAVEAAFPGRVLADAVDEVLGSAEASAAMDRTGERGGEVPAALARAIVAQAMLLTQDDPAAGELDGTRRDAIVAAVLQVLGESDRGIGASLGRFAGRLALRLGAARPIERRRAAITHGTAAGAGDILLYLARGQDIRDFIASTVDAVFGQVVIVAHSLGGIASVDLLVQREMTQVKALVTVGSQAPLMYEIGALPSLPFATPLPDHFPKWTNFYDRRDLLSFVGGPVFGSRCVDHPIDNRSPFPRSHSAYLGNDDFYEALDVILREA